jgi:hypothetical protein
MVANKKLYFGDLGKYIAALRKKAPSMRELGTSIQMRSKLAQ